MDEIENKEEFLLCSPDIDILDKYEYNMFGVLVLKKGEYDEEKYVMDNNGTLFEIQDKYDLDEYGRRIIWIRCDKCNDDQSGHFSMPGPPNYYAGMLYEKLFQRKKIKEPLLFFIF